MALNQPRPDGTPKVLVLRTFHVDHATWERFGARAEAQGTSRAAELRRLIDRSLEEEAA